MSAIKVTSIMPVYNGAAYLNDALDSFCEQTLEDTELLVIDDQSTDNSAEIIRDYQSRDPRIVYFKTDHRYGGPWGGRNLGIERARGEYLHFIDQDDRYASRFALSHAYATARRYQAPVLACNCDYIFGTPRYGMSVCPASGRLTYITTGPNRWQNFPNYPIVWQVLFNRQWLLAHPEVRFTENYRCEDSLFMLRVISAQPSLVTCARPLYAYRCNYRFVDITPALLHTHLEYVQPLLELYRTSGLDSYYGELTSRECLPYTTIGWNSPMGRIDVKELQRYYGYTQPEAQALLQAYNRLRDDYQQQHPLPAQRTLSHPVIRHSFAMGQHCRIGFYASGHEDYNRRQLQRFDKVRYVHLMGATQNFTPLLTYLSHGNSEEHLFIFVRSNDVMPYMHMYPVPMEDNVINFVNLQALNDYFYPLFEKAERISVHSLLPRPLYIFLNQHLELTRKSELTLFGVHSLATLRDDPVVMNVLSHLNTVHTLACYVPALQSLLPRAKVCATLTVKAYALPHCPQVSENPDTALIVSDRQDFVLQALTELAKTAIHHLICCFTNSTPFAFSNLQSALKQRTWPFTLQVSFGACPLLKLKELTPRLHSLWISQSETPMDTDLILCALQAHDAVYSDAQGEALLDECRAGVTDTL